MQQSLTLSTETPELQVRSAVPGKIHCAFLPNQDSTWQQHPECWNSCYLSGCLLLQPIRKQINKQTKKKEKYAYLIPVSILYQLRDSQRS